MAEIFDDTWQTSSRAELLASGLSSRGLTAAVREGALIRARRDRYVEPTTPRVVVQAVRVGGRLTCLSLLALLGVFVFRSEVVHVHVPRGMSRLRSAHSRRRCLERGRKRSARLHWAPLVDDAAGTSACVGVVDALVHSVLCQQPRHAVATLDNALNKGLITMLELDEVFHALPQKFQVLQGLVDVRAQSGPETLMRLMLRSLGCTVDLQVAFERVGLVDLVVDGWLVIECDSEAFHSSWEQQLEDRHRDRILASYGYPVLRVVASDVLYRPDTVLGAVRGLLRARAAAA